MEHPLRHTLADRAFLFDDPAAYLAGVDAALRAMVEVNGSPTEVDERSSPSGAATARTGSSR